MSSRAGSPSLASTISSLSALDTSVTTRSPRSLGAAVDARTQRDIELLLLAIQRIHQASEYGLVSFGDLNDDKDLRGQLPGSRLIHAMNAAKAADLVTWDGGVLLDEVAINLLPGRMRSPAAPSSPSSQQGSPPAPEFTPLVDPWDDSTPRSTADPADAATPSASEAPDPKPPLALNENYAGILMLAVEGGDFGQVQAICGGDDVDINAAGKTGFTPLMRAADRGHVNVVKLLLEAGADYTATTTLSGETALHLAAGKGYTEICRALLDAGADPQILTKNGWDSAMCASFRNHTETIMLLTSAGADMTHTLESGTSARELLSTWHFNEEAADRMVVVANAPPRERGISHLRVEARLQVESDSPTPAGTGGGGADSPRSPRRTPASPGTAADGEQSPGLKGAAERAAERASKAEAESKKRLEELLARTSQPITFPSDEPTHPSLAGLSKTRPPGQPSPEQQQQEEERGQQQALPTAAMMQEGVPPSSTAADLRVSPGGTEEGAAGGVLEQRVTKTTQSLMDSLMAMNQ